MTKWKLVDAVDEAKVREVYGPHPTIFCIALHHGGKFTDFPGRKYINGKKHYVDIVDMETFCIHDVDEMMAKLGYIDDEVQQEMYYHFRRPLGDLDFGTFALASDDDVRHLSKYVSEHKIIDVYIEHGQTKLHTYSMSPNPSQVRIVEIETPTNTARPLFLKWHDTGSSSSSLPNTQAPESDVNATSAVPNSPPLLSDPDENVNDPYTYETGFVYDEAAFDKDFGNEQPAFDNVYGNDDRDSGSEDSGSEESDSDDSDYLVDEDNMIADVEVDMRDFHMNIDQDAEWVPGVSKKKKAPAVTVVEEDIEVIDTDLFLSASSSDEGVVGERKRKIKAIRRAHENANAQVSEPYYLFQKFSSAQEFKDSVRKHSIDTRRELVFEKNDKTRVLAVCKGTSSVDGGANQESKCPWRLYVSKMKKDSEWVVKSYTSEHSCLQTRNIKACDYKFLSSQIVRQVESNPNIPIRALKEQLVRTYKVDISSMKTFRAREAALKTVRGDYAIQYSILRDYLEEVMNQNPDTTIKVECELEPNPNSDTRTFKRVYVCLGALKKGFAAGRRDFLGLDGAFMKGPYPGQILSAVAFDGNNCIYPVAYAVVEAETLSSWTWFLSNLGDDLGLGPSSNFTFISDRQKGLLPAVAKLFPCAEHRFCLRHIHENMRLRWKAEVFKNILWDCAMTSTVPEFEKRMEDLRKLNNECYEWLKKIPPQHWARSHFTGRAHCDVVLNNHCESFNSKLDDGRDAPIITCLEFIREYIMKKIVVVDKVIGKARGPLTPTASKTMEKIKDEASEYQAIFCGNGKYQVAGPWQDQCVVDVSARSCSCRRWELTGMPCKHGVAAIWDMRKNKVTVGFPENFVHDCYLLATWKEMYSHKVEPINGRRMWVKSSCPTTLLPPKHHVTIGRPKKKRRKSAFEKEDLLRGNRVSRAMKEVTCSKCGNTGHNARTCKGQKKRDGSTSGKKRVPVKGKGKEKEQAGV